MFNVPKRILFFDDTLSGQVRGKKASDIEERFARAVDKLPEWGYSFRLRISPLTHRVSGIIQNLPGEVEIDFLLYRGSTLLPIQIQGEIGHFYTAWQSVVDDEKEETINGVMRAYGAQPVLLVPEKREDLWRLANQENADQLAREILL